MNILMLTSSFPGPQKPYTGVFTRQWAEFLSERGHRVTVVTQRQTGSERDEIHRDIRIHRFEYHGWKENKTLANMSSAPLWFTLSYLHGMFHTARSVIRTEPIDVIHCAWVIPSGFVGILLRLFYGLPCVTVSHGSDLNVWKNRWLPGLFIRFVLKRTDHLITIGGRLRDRALECGMPDDRITPILCGSGGIDLNHYRSGTLSAHLRSGLGIEPDDVVGIMVARIQPPKRFDLLIDAAFRIRRAIPRFRLLIVGGHREECPWLTNASDPWGDTIVFAGPQPNERVRDFLHSADVCLYASNHEGVPSGILEALACGLPVVASNVGGIPEVVKDGDNGFLVSNETEVFAEKTIQLLSDSGLYARFETNATRFAEEHLSHERLMPQIENIYLSAMTTRKKAVMEPC